MAQLDKYSSSPILEANLNVCMITTKKLYGEAVVEHLNKRGDYKAELAADLSNLREKLADGCVFDIVIFDPAPNALRNLSRCMAAIKGSDDTRIGLVLDDVSPLLAGKLLRQGADGILTTDLSLRSFKSVVELIATGEVYVPKRTRRATSFGSDKNESPFPELEIEGIRFEILNLIASGQTNKEIAIHMGLSESHVKQTVRFLCQKLSAKNRANIVSKAIELGLI